MKIKILRMISKMTTFLKQYWSVLLVALSLVVVTLCYFIVQKHGGFEYAVNVQPDTVYVEKTKSGKDQFIVNEQLVAQNKKYAETIAALAKELQIKPKEIERIVEVNSSSDLSKEGSVNSGDTTVIIKIDSTERLYTKTTKYLTLKVRSYPDSLVFDSLEHRLYLTGAFTEVKKDGVVYNQFRVIPDDGFTKIIGLKNNLIRKEPEYSRWSIQVGGGMTYYDKPRPSVYIGIGYDLIRFKKKQ